MGKFVAQLSFIHSHGSYVLIKLYNSHDQLENFVACYLFNFRIQNLSYIRFYRPTL